MYLKKFQGFFFKSLSDMQRYVRESELVEQISLASFQNLLLQRSAKPGCNFVVSSHHLVLCFLVHNSSRSGQRRVGKMAWMDNAKVYVIVHRYAGYMGVVYCSALCVQLFKV